MFGSFDDRTTDVENESTEVEEDDADGLSNGKPRSSAREKSGVDKSFSSALMFDGDVLP